MWRWWWHWKNDKFIFLHIHTRHTPLEWCKNLMYTNRSIVQIIKWRRKSFICFLYFFFLLRYLYYYICFMIIFHSFVPSLDFTRNIHTCVCVYMRLSHFIIYTTYYHFVFWCIAKMRAFTIIWVEEKKKNWQETMMGNHDFLWETE